MGLNTKMIVTGDMTQIDLPYSQKSGLKDALEVLKDVKGIAKVEFDVKDIVRHKLVQRIVEAYAAPRPPEGGVGGQIVTKKIHHSILNDGFF